MLLREIAKFAMTKKQLSQLIMINKYVIKYTEITQNYFNHVIFSKDLHIKLKIVPVPHTLPDEDTTCHSCVLKKISTSSFSPNIGPKAFAINGKKKIHRERAIFQTAKNGRSMEYGPPNITK